MEQKPENTQMNEKAFEKTITCPIFDEKYDHNILKASKYFSSPPL